MKVLNVHTRVFNQPVQEISALLNTLSTENDRIWPMENWPKMKFKDGIKLGAKGGHGPIRYSVEIYKPEKCIQFRFLSPKGFNGIHKFDISISDQNKTELKHTIDMVTEGKSTFLWIFGIRHLHDALIEDGLDKMENILSGSQRKQNWSLWVKILRRFLK